MKSPRLPLALSLAGLLAACSSGSGSTSKVSLLLTDSSADLSAAVVTVSEIDLVGSDGSNVVLYAPQNPQPTSLLTLANDTATMADGVDVPVGTYTQLRFVITGGYIAVKQPSGPDLVYASSPTYAGLPAGTTADGTLQMPSYGTSGLKVNLPAGSQTVGTAAKILLVDFDVGQSFGQDAGASGMWVMHPVMTATELEFSGTVNVTLALANGVTLPAGAALTGFSAVLTNSGGSPKTNSIALSNGVYGTSFPYLIPGSYTLTLEYPATTLVPTPPVTSFTTSPAIPVTVTVASGQPTSESFTITAAQ